MNITERAERRMTKRRVAFLKQQSHRRHLAAAVDRYRERKADEQPITPRQSRLSRLAARKAEREAIARSVRPTFDTDSPREPAAE